VKKRVSPALLATALGCLLLAHGAAAAVDAKKPAKVPRPESRQGLFGYKVKEAAPLASKHAVVHYVRTGQDAPPLRDGNGNGHPDYVDAIAEAADEAIGAFVAFGFKGLLPDSAGGSTKPDLYVKALPSGIQGATLPHAAAVGGGFVVLDDSLRAVKGRPAVGSLRHTVAHELFHLVQFSYTPDGDIPTWAAEGMASAMAIYAFPFSQDPGLDFLVDVWLKTPWMSLYDERISCVRCYGGAIWWRFVFQLEGRVIPAYLGRLYGYKKSGQKILDGTQPLTEILERKGHKSLFANFSRFSVNLYQGGFRPRPLYGLRAQNKVQVSKIRIVNGLSTHYIPIAVPPGSNGLRVAIATGGGPFPNITFATGGPKGRFFAGPGLHQIRGKLYEVRFANDGERKQNMLIVSSGRKEGVAYQVAYQAF
jgi:hypothetical protein